MKSEKTPPNKPRQRGPSIPRLLYMGYLCVCLSVCLVVPASAATIWEKASEIMQDVYTQILTRLRRTTNSLPYDSLTLHSASFCVKLDQ